MTKIKLLTAAVSALALILVLVWIQGGFHHKVPAGETKLPKEQIANVKTVKAEKVETSGEVTVSGTVLARDTAKIAARVGGYVTELKVDAGSTVKKGDLLLKIEARELEERSAQAKAALESAKVDMEKTKQDFERYKILFQEQAIAKKEYDDVS
ncbi:MAG: efflux RND transporter periplasmic adaptor subunit, partial [Desulfomonilaceae bacterium]